MRLVIYSLIAAAGVVVSGLEFVDHGYKDLLVTISPDLPPDNAVAILDNLKSWITSGSSTLYSSSRGWAFIKNVKILIPETWKSIAVDDTAENIVYNDGTIRVDATSAIYGNSPFTLQTGGCGEAGEYIQVSAPFLKDFTSMTETFGPLGQVFVHEWAKYRYGVFEEFGFPGDEKYPMFYYKVQWTSSGQENVVAPNFCTNNEITDFSMVNALTGEECSYDSDTGLPDFNCIPVLGQNNEIDSSIMAIPYLEGSDQFCDDTEVMYHRVDIPTKHNDICEGRSTFSVIQDHPDFINFAIGNEIENTVPTFEILRSVGSNSFVMVLDASVSMRNNCKHSEDPDCQLRVDRMIQSAKRWIQYDIRDNVPVGLIKFSNISTELFPLAPINSTNRDKFINELDKIELSLETCLGNALREGLQTLRRGGVPTGGVMMFLTDGEYFCKGDDNSTIKDVIPEVKEQGVRVVTIAFGNDADPDLIELAKETDGKAYFVADNSGPEDINTAMQGSLTYQPSVPSSEVDIIIYENTFSSFSNKQFRFVIDELIGKNVTVQIDISGNATGAYIMINDLTQSHNGDGVFEYVYPGILQPGSYDVTIQAISSTNITFASIKVTSKSISDTIPIMTECWSSVGNNKVDLSNPELKIAVIAKVLQATNPVIGAKVTAYIESEASPQPIELTLFDEGSDPDSIANDGIYARYFTTFDPNKENTRYSLKCQVESTDGSQINQGFLESRKKSKSLPSNPTANNPICCGSNTLRDDSILTPTGDFKRSSPGGSVEIENADKVEYPPGRVNDLRGGNNVNLTSFSLSFTSAGETLDFGTAKDIKVYYAQNSSVLNNIVPTSNAILLTVEDVLNPGSLNPAKAGTKVEIAVKRVLSKLSFEEEQQYFFRLQTIVGNKSTWSNIASVYFPKVQTSSAKPSTTSTVPSTTSTVQSTTSTTPSTTSTTPSKTSTTPSKASIAPSKTSNSPSKTSIAPSKTSPAPSTSPMTTTTAKEATTSNSSESFLLSLAIFITTMLAHKL